MCPPSKSQLLLLWLPKRAITHAVLCRSSPKKSYFSTSVGKKASTCITKGLQVELHLESDSMNCIRFYYRIYRRQTLNVCLKNLSDHCKRKCCKSNPLIKNSIWNPLATKLWYICISQWPNIFEITLHFGPILLHSLMFITITCI